MFLLIFKNKLKTILFQLYKPFVNPIFRLFTRESIARVYLHGNGIEIGALHNPLQVPRNAKVKYVDRLLTDNVNKHYPGMSKLSVVKVDIYDDAERLEKIADESFDFVIANHFLEHCENPLMALLNMIRVLKTKGILYLAVPDKRFTFDRNRDVTTLDHIIKDFHNGPNWSKRQHFEDHVLQEFNNIEGESLEEKIENLLKINYSIHFHIWTQKEIFELLLEFRKLCSFDIEIAMKHKNELITILRKLG